MMRLAGKIIQSRASRTDVAGKTWDFPFRIPRGAVSVYKRPARRRRARS